MYTTAPADSQDNRLSETAPRRGVAPAAPPSEPTDIILTILTRVVDARVTLTDTLADSQLLPAPSAAAVGPYLLVAARQLEELYRVLGSLLVDDLLSQGGR